VSLEQSIQSPHSEPKNAVHIFQNYFFKILFNIIFPLMAMASKKSLLIMIAIQISKGIWHPQYNTKQEIVMSKEQVLNKSKQN